MKKLLLVITICVITFSSYGNIKRICKVQYKTQDGWSKYYKLEVQFVTGRELNKMFESFSKYSNIKNYCLIWFESGGGAILEIRQFLITGEDFDSEDFRDAFSVKNYLPCKQINGETEREWRIEAKESFNFIDEREVDE